MPVPHADRSVSGRIAAAAALSAVPIERSRRGTAPGKHQQSPTWCRSCHEGSGSTPGTANRPLRRAEPTEVFPAPPPTAAPPFRQAAGEASTPSTELVVREKTISISMKFEIHNS
ncbi:uncharacterized protein LOC125548997 [Triticum urartu]|uniref:uncharacterized protein LOC125548997 n=1 Tax=Triticum urartu TaxID=4572 RepID=UPI002043B47E|nr:uncharacterized protein LOC125548997 [Triticum urartu]